MSLDRMRFKNFDTIRLLAASSVILSHAFLIAEGTAVNEPFWPWLGNILGIYGVYVFLIISGFLVSRSLQQSSSLRQFLWKRVLRIYPGLIACAVLCAFVVAPFYSSLGAAEYLRSDYGIRYVVGTICDRWWDIKTVTFYDTSEFSRGVNGSLWTIAQEMKCYFLLFTAAALGLFNRVVAAIALALVSILFGFELWRMGGIVSGKFACALPSFIAGVLMYFIHVRYRLSGSIALGCFAGLVVAAVAGVLEKVFPLPAAYIVIYLALSSTISLGNGARFGDLSYGTYLYAWPVEQVVRSFLGEGASPWLLFFIALPLALGCGWISWHVVEKRALRWGSASWGRVGPGLIHTGSSAGSPAQYSYATTLTPDKLQSGEAECGSRNVRVMPICPVATGTPSLSQIARTELIGSSR